MKLLQEVLQLETGDALLWLEKYMKKHFGYSQYSGGKLHTFFRAPQKGGIPVCLVAHVDTVHQRPPKFNEIMIDKGMVCAPTIGLGADDRAGVWAILKILHEGLRPHVLFTDEEERGCQGAREVCKYLDREWIEDDRLDIRCLIQMDRRGEKDSVFYDCTGNKEWIAWVNSFGFEKAWGSCTDVRILSPAWGVASVNLSTGYYHEHSQHHFMVVPHTVATMKKVCKMLSSPPEKVVEFREEKTYSNSYPSGNFPQERQGPWTGYLGADGFPREDEHWRCLRCACLNDPPCLSTRRLCDRCENGAVGQGTPAANGHASKASATANGKAEQRASWLDTALNGKSFFP